MGGKSRGGADEQGRGDREELRRTYEYLGDEKLVDLIRASFAGALEERGYHLEVAAAGPGTPHVYEYRRDRAVVAVVVDDSPGQKWESLLAVETRGPSEELEEVVSAAVAGLLADLARGLVESVLDDSYRAAVVRALSRIIATLE